MAQNTVPEWSGKLPSEIEAALNSFDRGARLAALAEAAALLNKGVITRPAVKRHVNVHAHTFFSYSSLGYSPERLVWEAVGAGLAVVGSTDFDVLDAMDEMYAAGVALGVKATVSLETRTFAREYADKEISSPGEPGVMYVMGVGFSRLPKAGTAAGNLFASLSGQSRQRNIVMIDKVNSATAPVALDYEKDVLPLTPSGNATERHICSAYAAKAAAHFPYAAALAEYWAGVLGVDKAKAAEFIANPGALENNIRAKLMKRGGIGYTQPDRDSFPAIVDFFQMTKEAGAVPCLAWLDGASAGEADPEQLIADAMSWGARAVNIIPDRNWNIADPAAKEKKTAALAAFVAAAGKHDLPILVGTELNGPGQKFVDSFDAPELAPYVDDFMNGAYWLFGHTVLDRLANGGAMSEWAAKKFGDDRAKANAYYSQLGSVASADYMQFKNRGASGDGPEEISKRLKG